MASEAAVETSRGRHTSENAGMSSERRVRNRPPEDQGSRVKLIWVSRDLRRGRQA